MSSVFSWQNVFSVIYVYCNLISIFICFLLKRIRIRPVISCHFSASFTELFQDFDVFSISRQDVQAENFKLSERTCLCQEYKTRNSDPSQWLNKYHQTRTMMLYLCGPVQNSLRSNSWRTTLHHRFLVWVLVTILDKSFRISWFYFLITAVVREFLKFSAIKECLAWNRKNTRNHEPSSAERTEKVSAYICRQIISY